MTHDLFREIDHRQAELAFTCPICGSLRLFSNVDCRFIALYSVYCNLTYRTWHQMKTVS